jgi:predicted transcriptional regulator
LTKPKEKPTPLTDKAALVREALDQVTGGHTVPSEEVEAWIESWDTADEQPKPKPRKR